ncbi:inner-membrane translocator [Ktedonosporobacter rubrisoli]|uniref:Xylose transport system permease protein XylH n=1 Tax=Ktedonosporobacter rubrisoli TaxID=2509675 RepID=A0A4P6K3U7_KTERU|nr:inner-membrane translocator [Ktedonosporobacter rubrisoli]QBD82642.1 inner-membrane translocator [Ktedonosporobacter rubrisoli]
MSEILENENAENIQSLTEAVEAPSYTQQRSFGQLLRSDLGFLPVVLTLLIIVVCFALISRGLFLAPGNLSNLLQQIIGTAVASLGAALVLLLGEVDLSIAAVATMSGVIVGILAERLHVPGWEAIIIGLLSGTVAGLINGFFVAYLRIPSFIVTLATLIGFTGFEFYLLQDQAALAISNPTILILAGSAYSFLPDIYGVGLPTLAVIIFALGEIWSHLRRKRQGLRTKPLYQLIGKIVLVAVIVEGVIAILENTPGPARGTYLGVPISAAILFGLILIVWLLLSKTTFGRHVYAVGGNQEAARRAGINVVGTKLIIFALCSTLAAAAGILLTSRLNAANTQVPLNLLLESIAAAVIGGVSLFGGVGSVWAIVLGALIIGSLENGLGLLNLGVDVQNMVECVVLLIAVTADALIRRAQARSKSGR